MDHMKHSKRLLCFLLALAMLWCTGCAKSASQPEAEAPQEETTGYEMGDKMPDFTVTTFDGKTLTLSEVLQEKEMVLINVWATWCTPCAREFPFLQEAYEQYQDRVEVIALSSESEDTDEILAEYAAEKGLTFPVARDSVGLADAMEIDAIPTSIVVDRFGRICFIEIGSQPDAESFTCLFDAFLGDDYTQSIQLDAIPGMKPNVVPSSEKELSAALNGEGGTLTFTNDDDVYSWPMVVGEVDGRTVAISSNHAHKDSRAMVNTTVDVKAGDALAVTFKISCEPGYDLMQLQIDGETVKYFSGEHDWMTYAYRFDTAGKHTVSLVYTKNTYTNGGEDTLWLDSVELLSGAAADAAVGGNPAYVYGSATTLTLTNPAAREIVFDHPEQIIADATYYIVPDETADFLATLAPGVDPETVVLYFDDFSTQGVIGGMTEDGYVLHSSVNSMETTGTSYSFVYLLSSLDQSLEKCVFFFASEENIEAFIAKYLSDQNGEALVTWQYADASTTTGDIAKEVTYTVRYVDQDGQPVAGVSCQICDDSTCLVVVSDADGVCQFTLPPYPYEVHTLKLPKGYEGDTTTVTIAPAEGGELTFTLQKN